MQQHGNAATSGSGAAQTLADIFSAPRSKYWHGVEQAFRALPKNSVCAACDLQGAKQLQVHHIVPFQYCVYLGRPELEFDPRNLITLCEGPDTNDHHITIGHLGDFQHLNEMVEQDITGPWKGLIKAAIELLADWLGRERWPQKPLSDAQTARLLALITSRYGEKPQQSIEELIVIWWGKDALASRGKGDVPASAATGS